jgi:hypothetical protein
MIQPEYLTRAQADGLIADAADDVETLRAISTHWIGHANEDISADDLAALLFEYVEDSTDGDEVRSYGPHDDDLTNLTAPPCQHEPAHVDGRATFCRVCGEAL